VGIHSDRSFFPHTLVPNMSPRLTPLSLFPAHVNDFLRVWTCYRQLFFPPLSRFLGGILLSRRTTWTWPSCNGSPTLPFAGGSVSNPPYTGYRSFFPVDPPFFRYVGKYAVSDRSKASQVPGLFRRRLPGSRCPPPLFSSIQRYPPPLFTLFSPSERTRDSAFRWR